MVWVSLIHNGIAIPQTYNYMNSVNVIYKNNVININNNLAAALYLYKKQNHFDKVFDQNFICSIKEYLPISCKNISLISELSIKISPLSIKQNVKNYNKYKYCYVNGKKKK